MDTKGTPMTDAVIAAMDGSSATWVLRGMVPVEFARHLERELAEYADDKSRLAAMVLDFREQRDRLVEAARRVVPSDHAYDTAQLDGLRQALAAVKQPTTNQNAERTCADDQPYTTMQNNYTPSEGKDSELTADKSALRGAACSLSSDALKVWLECEKDTPFFCRRSIDKSCYEVGKQTNDDWRECISEDRIFLGRFATEEEAQAAYDEHRIKWMWEEICKANTQIDHP